MKVGFTSQGWNDYQHLIAEEPKILLRLNTLLEECRRNPFTGTGKPEPLKGNLKGWWSRRITQEDRLVYRVSGNGADQVLEISQCRFHY